MSESPSVLTLVLVDGVAHDAAIYFSKLRDGLQGLRQENLKMMGYLEEVELKATSYKKEVEELSGRLDSIWKEYVDLKKVYGELKNQNWKLSEDFKRAQEIWKKEKEAFAKGGASD